MKVLFFSNIPVEQSSNGGYNGGGWISSLINHLQNRSNVEVGVGYFGPKDFFVEKDGVSLFQIQTYSNKGKIKKIARVLELLGPNYLVAEKKKWKYYEKKISNVVNYFSPDIIQIFGSERHFGLIANVVNVPVVLHIQGILNPCFNAFFPPGFSWQLNGLFKDKLKLFLDKRMWEQSCFREKEIFKRVRYYIGRTDWDERVTKIFNPNARYFYGSEILRNSFYEEKKRDIPFKLTIISTISSPFYKGFDMVLKTANILKKELSLDFEWKVFGNVNPKVSEKIVGLSHNEVNVAIMGVASQEQLQKEMCASTLYMHPSYIDNSPNSVCEAQLLGVTVIAANVGGVSSIVEDGKTGFLVPANDPYQAAYLIKKLNDNKQLNVEIGSNARKQACIRHDPEKIIRELFSTYECILEKENNELR